MVFVAQRDSKRRFAKLYAVVLIAVLLGGAYVTLRLVAVFAAENKFVNVDLQSYCRTFREKHGRWPANGLELKESMRAELSPYSGLVEARKYQFTMKEDASGQLHVFVKSGAGYPYQHELIVKPDMRP